MPSFPARLEPFLAPESPVQQLARRLADAGHECYLVGGSVRDAFLDRVVGAGETVDVDITTDARPDVVERLVRAWADARVAAGQAVRHHRLRARTARRSRSPRSAPRCTGRRAASPRSRSPTTSRPTSRAATSPSTRWRSRLPDPVLVDPFGGAVDLAARRLRTPLAPEVSFLDDPLRMLRAARFVAEFGLVPDPELVAAIEEHAAPARDRQRGAHPRRAVEAAARRRPDARGSGCSRETRPRRRVPPRAQRDAARAGPDPHAQGRARAHDRGRARTPDPSSSCASPRCSTTSASRRPASFADGGGELPPPRGGRRAHDRGAAARAAVPERRRRRRHEARLPPPAHPHLRDGLDRQGGAPLRPRRRAAARASSTTSSAATAPRATRSARERSQRRMDELEARIARAARAGGARRRSARRSTAVR